MLPGSRNWPPPGTRVAAGLSGGVDSAMAAALLQEHGCEVIGVTMAVWDGSVPIPDQGASGCYGPGEARDIEAAAGVARRLGIPHHVIDLADEYRKNILDYVRSEYHAGRTPNPCVRCNRRMKFGLLPERARAAGILFERFATGHYARCLRETPDGPASLFRARDASKDQSYFLAHLSRAQLNHLVFPLGDLAKTEVRTLARARGFSDLADRAESQDFLESSSLDALIGPGAPPPGDIVDDRGCILGRHRGLAHYTIGQRKGLGIGGAGEPFYVIALDALRNRVVVGRRDALRTSSFHAVNCSWLAWDRPPGESWRAEVCLRLRIPAAPATVSPLPGADADVRVDIDEPQAPVAPGQTAVFYDGDRVLGAGTIALP